MFGKPPYFDSPYQLVEHQRVKLDQKPPEKVLMCVKSFKV